MLVFLLYINTLKSQSNESGAKYVFLQGGYYSNAGNGDISGFETVSLGYLTETKKNGLKGIELIVKVAFDKNTVRSVPTFLDTTPTQVGGIVDFFEIDINYIKTKEYINSDKISFGLMSGVGFGFSRQEINPRINGGMSVDNTYDIHIYTGPYLNVNLADKFSLLLDWNVFELLVGTSTSDFVDENGVLFEQGPFLDLELDGLVNHLHIGVMYTL